MLQALTSKMVGNRGLLWKLCGVSVHIRYIGKINSYGFYKEILM